MENTAAAMPSQLELIMKELFAVREEKAAINKELKPLNARQAELEAQAIEILQDRGEDGAVIKGLGSVSMSSEIVPSEIDWNVVHQFIQETGAFHLMNRAMNAKAYREMLELGDVVPGVVPYSKTKLSLTKR